MLEQEKSNESNSQNDEKRDVEEDVGVGFDEFSTVVDEDALDHQGLLVHHQYNDENDDEQGNYYQNRDFDASLCD